MHRINLAKKLSLALALLMLLLAMTACSSASNPPASSEPPASENDESAASDEPATENTEPSGQAVGYENQEFGISMSVPAAWSAPEEVVNENGLTMLSGTETLDNSVMVLVRPIPETSPTLEEYKETNTASLEELYTPEMIEMNEIVQVNGTDFLKVLAADTTPDEELHQVIYTAFKNDSAYEIVMTLSPDFYAENAELLDEIEKSIQIS